MSVIPPFVYQLGVGGIGGFIAGYALRKLLKIVTVIVGLFILALVYLSYRGILTVNYGELGNLVSDAIGLTGQVPEWITPIITNLPFAGAFGTAFFLGFKMG